MELLPSGLQVWQFIIFFLKVTDEPKTFVAE